MAADDLHRDGARLICLALTYAAPILRQIVLLVHALRDHPHPAVRALANEKLPPPQEHQSHPVHDTPHKRRKTDHGPS